MKKIVFALILLPLALVGQGISPDKISRIDSLCQRYFKTLDAGGVVMIAQHGTPFFKKAYGQANAELNVGMTTDHKFGIGSISKQFAAVAILLLQKDGKLSVKDDIRKFLPSYNSHGKKIAIAHILSHTSGIPSYTELYGFDTLYNRRFSNHQLVKVFEAQPLLFEPGSNWSYSNSGFVLAALIVEKVSGQPFNDFLHDKIFKPLLMTETTIGSSNFVVPNKTAEYAGIVAKGRFKMDTQYDWYWAFGAGQIVSTAGDMLKWDEALYNEKFIPSELLSLANQNFMLTTGQPANYGLGWGIGTIDKKALIQHGGAIGGYRAQAVRVPEDHLYVLVLANYGTVNASLVSNKILSMLYEIPELKKNAKVYPDTKGIEGVYESLNAGSRLQTNYSKRPVFFTIRADSNMINVFRTGGTESTLSAADIDIFFNPNNPFVQWHFDRNSKGEVLGFRVSSLFGTFGPDRYNKKKNVALPPVFTAQKSEVETLKKFAGVYEHEFGDRIQIVIENDTLKMTDPVTGQTDDLLFLGINRFFIAARDAEYFFETDKKGNTVLRFFDGVYERIFRRVDEKY